MIPAMRFILLSAALSTAAMAEVRLPKTFTTGAVLQRDRAVPVWGWATAGKKVSVKFGGQEKSATAGQDGRWRVDLDSMPANAQGRSLEVTEEGLPPVKVDDLLVGEVWLASGQSNMEWSITTTRKEDQDIAFSGPVPLLRLLNVPKKASAFRQDDVDAAWVSATPETCRDFSAVAYFFGRRLTEELKVPVGMIASSWGGSRIEPWFAEEGLEGIPDLQEMKTIRAKGSPETPEYREAAKVQLAATRAWLDQADAAVKKEAPLPPQPAMPEILGTGPGQPLGLYQAMIHPLVPYGIRGFLWYQGESNLGEGLLYTLKMEALIAGWRHQFGVPNAPFLYTQIAPYNYGDNRGPALPELWVAQEKVLKIPNTGMAVTMDIGNPRDIHPNIKSEVGYRLARWALADTYGKTGIVTSGPLYKGFKKENGALRISYTSGEGLKTRDGKAPSHFEIAGTDGVYSPAEATIAGSEIVLKSAAVPQPAMARFAWSQVAEPNLCNGAGLPAAAFNTHWPEDPELGRNLALGRPVKSSSPNTHGWDSGVTDGSWVNGQNTCYATSEAPEFPKTVTVDLGKTVDLQAVRFGAPGFGSTKTIAISTSADGQNFQDAGSHVFPFKKEERKELRFPSRQARYVRATFVDHYAEQNGYAETFGFLTELEAYAGVK